MPAVGRLWPGDDDDDDDDDDDELVVAQTVNIRIPGLRSMPLLVGAHYQTRRWPTKQSWIIINYIHTTHILTVPEVCHFGASGAHYQPRRWPTKQPGSLSTVSLFYATLLYNTNHP